MSYSIVSINDCTDEGQGGLAQAKIQVAYERHADHHGLAISGVSHIGVGKFNTRDLGYKFADVAASIPHPEKVIFAINAAQFSTTNGTPVGHKGNIRKNFVFGRLKNGALFAGTGAGYCLSFVRSQLDVLLTLTDSNNGDPFRSYKVLPEPLVEFGRDVLATNLGQRLAPIDNPANAVPALPDENFVAAIDNFHNIKLVLSEQTRRRLTRLYRAKKDGDVILKALFREKSCEFDHRPRGLEHFNVRVVEDMSEGRAGELVLSLYSSSTLWTNKGDPLPIAQIARISDDLGLPLPQVGAKAHLRLAC